MLARSGGNTRIIQVDQRTGKAITKNLNQNAKPTLK
jgi:aspartate oxidase